MREWELHLGDALGVLPGMPDGSADAVVADPPAGISMMGLPWDSFTAAPPTRSGYVAHNDSTMLANGRGLTISASARNREAFVAFLTPIMAQCLRVLKPGGYGLVWALPRTSHWTATALEDAGFEIRDVVVHITGQGFPKGKGCLKPAAENWILCRRPGPRVLPLNIDACRIPIVGPVDPQRGGYNVPGNGKVGAGGVYNEGWNQDAYGGPKDPHPDSPRHDARGRWPANLALSHHESCVCRGTKRVKAAGWRDEDGRRGRRNGTAYNCSRDGSLRESASAHHAGPDGAEDVEDWACHPECPVFLLDSQAGERTSGKAVAGGHKRNQPPPEGIYGNGRGLWREAGDAGRLYGDTGNVSRFFYVAKADRADRGEGNDHPCTKSTALMQWLCKLVTRPGETVLDPFMGSGSTGVSCLRIERRFIGVERDRHYFEIAQRRLAAVDGPLFAAPAGEAAP